MKTLITGLDGFTGSYLQPELKKQKHTIVGLSSDLTDAKAVAAEIKKIQPDMVAHLAGISFIGYGNASAFYEVNLIGTHNLLKALDQYAPNVSSILLASSANIYGNQTEGIVNENTPPHPINDYSVSKLAMEMMANLWMDKLPLFIVRPFNYTGIGQDENFLIPKIISHFKRKEAIIELGNLDVGREFGDVRDVVKIYRKLLKKCPVGKTLNICTGQDYSLMKIISLCEKITGHKIATQVNPKFVRDNEVRILKGDNSLLENIIGDYSTKSLEKTLDWMLKDIVRPHY